MCCLQALAEVLLEALALGRLAAPAGGADAACSSSDDDLVCLTPAPDAHARLRESLAALLAAHRELSGALRRAGPLRCLLLRVRGALGGAGSVRGGRGSGRESCTPVLHSHRFGGGQRSKGRHHPAWTLKCTNARRVCGRGCASSYYDATIG